MNPVNPKVSFSSIGKKAYNGSPTKPVELYNVLKQCASGSWMGKEKGFSCIFPYVSSTMTSRPTVFDGVVFIDLDKFNEHSNLKGMQEVIFNKFDDLCKCMPNLLAMKYSPSGNIHAFVYHRDIKNEKEYRELGTLYLCCLSAAIKKVTGIDLRDFEGVLDGHQTSATQKFNVNHSEFKWNTKCCHAVLSKQDLKRIKAEYANIFVKLTERRIYDIESTALTGKGSMKIDKDYSILGWTGYDARTVIAAAAYFHFRKDLTKVREWLESFCSNAAEIGVQMDNMIRNNTIEHKYHTSVEKFLFGNDGKKVTLEEGEYLSDKIDFNDWTGKWYYIISNTNTGKTELVKSFALTGSKKVVILQMNKALRDGKKQGIETITMGNFRWDEVIPREQIHTTVEGFIRNCGNLDLTDYTIIVDEAHLLQDYSAIDGKMKTNRELLEILPHAGRIIFMSATPKTEIKLYPFEIYEFEKMQNQTLDIVCHPLKYAGKGSKEAARYNYMFNCIKKFNTVTGNKGIIFSNKHQECWKKYGLKDLDYTWFHAQNKEHEHVCSILNYNKLETEFTLATNYLGVGVEIKGEKEIDIWFDLDEGWDRDFIIQSIGRPRDASIIHVHFFFTVGRKRHEGRLNEAEVESIRIAFENLIDTSTELPTVNLIAAKMTNVYDYNFNIYSCKDKVQALKIGQMISNKDYMTINDRDILKTLPYKKIATRFVDSAEIDTDGKTRLIRHETELETHLVSRSNNWWNEHSNTTYETILNEIGITIIDKKNALEMLRKCKYIWRNGVDLVAAVEYFGSINKARDIVNMLVNYCNVKAGKMTVTEFEGANDNTIEQIKRNFETVEYVFTKEYLDWRIDKLLIGETIRTNELKIDEMISDILGITNVEDASVGGKCPNMFRGDTYKDDYELLKHKRLVERNKSCGKSIEIKNTETGEVLEFATTRECIKYLGVGSKTWSKFIKGGNVKKLDKWQIMNTMNGNNVQ